MKIENLINKHTDQLDWNHASKTIDVMQIDEQLFAYLSYFWDWVWISIKQSLCEKFMRKWKQYILWNLICEYQFLSEPFMEEIIEEFKGNLNYFPISKNYTLYFVLSYNLKKKHNLNGLGLNKYEI